MDRLELVPGDVRGGGNITLPKSPDFRSDKNTSMVDTYLTERFVPIAENDFQYVYRSISSNGLHIVCDAPRRVSSGDSVTVNVSVLRNDSIVSDTSVTLMLRSMEGTVFYEESVTVTDSQPVFTVSVPEGTGIFCEWFVRAYHVDYQGVNFRQEVMIDTGLDFDFNVVGDKDTIQIGETANIVGVLTGTSGDDVIGIPGQTVNFYEQWTPGLRVSATPGIIQSGDESTIKAQLIDTTDGSLVREEGHTVNFYWDDAPVPVPTTLDVDFDKTILSYADGDSAYVIVKVYDQLGNAMPNQSVSVSRSDGVSWTVETDMNGQGSFSYFSQGIGDVSFTFECMNLQETYEIHDYWKYIETGSKTFSSSSMNWEVLSDLNGIGDFELTYEISATGNKGFAIAMSSDNTETTNINNKSRGQVDGAGYYGTYTDINGSQTYTTYSSQYSANTYFTVTLQCVDGHITITHNGKTHTDNRTFNLRYLMIGNWNSAKTINYKNLIVKPL